MQKHLSGIFFCMFFFYHTFAQISGRTIDSQNGSGLEGATILSNTGSLYTTDSDGYFLIPESPGNPQDLKFSFIGYKSKTVHVLDKTPGILISLEPETQNIQELVVKISGFPASILNSTGSVSSLSRENLQIRDNIVLNDAINTIPGVYLSGGGYNTNRLTIRGIGSRSPYSSNRIRAYLDDIPLTSGDGITSIEDIDMAAISRIEILKGPSSAVFGSGLGGVVRMFSFQPVDEGFSLSLNTEASSFGTFRNAVRTGFTTAKSSFSLAYSNSRSEGFRQNSRYSRNSLLFAANRYFNKTSFKVTLLYTGVEAQIPSSVNLNTFKTEPHLAAPNWLAIKGFEKYKKLLLGVTTDTKLSRSISNKLSVSASYSDPYESRPFNILDEISRSAGIKDYLHYTRGKFEFLAGGDAFLEGFNWIIFETISGNKGEVLANNHEKRFYLNSFALSRYRTGKNFTAELGFNINILNYRLDDLFGGDSIDLSGNYRYNPVISPRLGINYRMDSEISLHASIGHGFSAPSLEETLLPGGQINTNLKPESGWNFDIGIRGITLGILSYDITAYHIALSNLLVTRRITEEIFTGINAGRTSHTGVESMLKLSLLSPGIRDKTELSLTSSFAASINQFKDFTDNNNNYSGKILPGIPSTLLNHELKFKLLKFMELSVFHKFAGKQFLNDSNTKNYEGWQTTDLRAAYSIQIGPRHNVVKFYGGVKNLFDSNYAGMVLVNAPSFGTSEPRYYYPGLPKNYFAGIIIEFK